MGNLNFPASKLQNKPTIPIYQILWWKEKGQDAKQNGMLGCVEQKGSTASSLKLQVREVHQTGQSCPCFSRNFLLPNTQWRADPLEDTASQQQFHWGCCYFQKVVLDESQNQDRFALMYLEITNSCLSSKTQVPHPQH